MQQGIITAEQLATALTEQQKDRRRLGDYLVENGITTDEDIALALHLQLGIDRIDLRGIKVPPEVLGLVPGSVLRKHSVLPVGFDEHNSNVLLLAMADPLDMVAQDDISIITNCLIEPLVSTHSAINSVLDKYFGTDEAMSAAEQYAKEREQQLQQLEAAAKGFLAVLAVAADDPNAQRGREQALQAVVARSQKSADDFQFDAAQRDSAMAAELGASQGIRQQLAQRLQRAQLQHAMAACLRLGLVGQRRQVGGQRRPRRLEVQAPAQAAVEHMMADLPLSQTHGGLLPVDKVTAIKAAQAHGEKVMFVGDGINDGPALAQADVGVAMGSGMDVAIDTADVILTSSRLTNLGVLFDLAKRMDNNIKQNLVIAIGTVALLLSGLLIGLVDMASGMLFHEISILLVIANALRLRHTPRKLQNLTMIKDAAAQTVNNEGK